MNGVIDISCGMVPEAIQISMFGDVVPVSIDVDKPLYRKDDVIDIRTNPQGLPNRVQILGVTLSIGRSGMGYKYKCEFEDTHEVGVMDESILRGIVLAMDAPVYEKDVIKLRYAQGWRFYGNHRKETASDIAMKLACDDRLKHVRMCEAYNKNGKLSTDQVSIWVQYHKPIDGCIHQVSSEFAMDIK